MHRKRKDYRYFVFIGLSSIRQWWHNLELRLPSMSLNNVTAAKRIIRIFPRSCQPGIPANHSSSFPSLFLPPHPNMFMIIPPKEPARTMPSQQSSHPLYLKITPQEGCENLPPGGYIFPLLSTCGPHEHHWLSGTESRTDGMCDPQPIQVLPSARRC